MTHNSQILITGGTGFVGGFLKKQLQNQGDVYLSSRHQNNRDTLQLDLLQPEGTRDFFDTHDFDKIFHLAAQSNVPLSFEKPFHTLHENISLTLQLFKTLHTLHKTSRVILAGSAQVYQASKEALREDSPLNPLNPYAISKAVTDHFFQYTQQLPASQMNSNLLRLFNHTGPGQSDKFVLGSFSKQLAEIKLGLRDPVIKVGNLNAYRDFLDVRDVCIAYDLAASYTKSGETYNVCSGKAHKVRDLLEQLIEISETQATIELDPNRLRPAEVPTILGSYEKINRDLGWKPTISIEQTLKDMFEASVQELKESTP